MPGEPPQLLARLRPLPELNEDPGREQQIVAAPAPLEREHEEFRGECRGVFVNPRCGEHIGLRAGGGATCEVLDQVEEEGVDRPPGPRARQTAVEPDDVTGLDRLRDGLERHELAVVIVEVDGEPGEQQPGLEVRSMVAERPRGLEGELGVLPRPIEISDLEGVCGELEARVHHAWGIPGLRELPERFLKVPRRVVHPRQRIPGRSRSGAAKARGAGRQSASLR